MLRILTDQGTKYCGRVDQHDYPLYLVNDIVHTKTRAMSPQINGICERSHQGKMCCGRTPMQTLLDGTGSV